MHETLYSGSIPRFYKLWSWSKNYSPPPLPYPRSLLNLFIVFFLSVVAPWRQGRPTSLAIFFKFPVAFFSFIHWTVDTPHFFGRGHILPPSKNISYFFIVFISFIPWTLTPCLPPPPPDLELPPPTRPPANFFLCFLCFHWLDLGIHSAPSRANVVFFFNF